MVVVLANHDTRVQKLREKGRTRLRLFAVVGDSERYASALSTERVPKLNAFPTRNSGSSRCAFAIMNGYLAAYDKKRILMHDNCRTLIDADSEQLRVC